MKNKEIYFFFFSSRRRHTRFSRDWSSDVCSSDLRGEHRQAQEQPLLLWREQVEGPVDDPAEGVVARVAAAVGRPEQLEPRIQPVGEVVDGQRADPRGGQLDRQREAVEGAADVANPL